MSRAGLVLPMDDVQDTGVPPGRPPRREGAVARWATTAWCLLAGALLAVAPRAEIAWEAGILARHEWLPAAMASDAARWGVSGFGLVLLALGAWDVSRFIVDELT